MKLVQINSVCGSGSTGKICVGISQVLNSANIENNILYCQGNSDYPQAIKCIEKCLKWQTLRSRVLGNYGFNSVRTTKMLIQALDSIQPDIVHLHNLHAHNCNMKILMDYLRKSQIKIFWTFHDCWTFTAYCPYFDMVKCEQWKVKCHDCIQHKRFSWFLDRSKWLFEKKQECLKDLDLTIITPSEWLADMVKLSFLSEYPVKVIKNGINLEVFKPVPSNFREKYNIPEQKFVLLGVADKWAIRKGPDTFIRLAGLLDPKKFQIVMVGTDDTIDKQLPPNIISIHRTQNQAELAEIYTAADLFVNPTREEVFGLVNVEANACGTPVLTYRTGGSPECIDESSGMVVDCDDEQALLDAIVYIEKNRPFSREDCRFRAMQFDEKRKFEEYKWLYEMH